MIIFCICVLVIGVIALWKKMTEPKNVVTIPSISQQVETDSSLHEKQQTNKTLNRRPMLVKQNVRQQVIPTEHSQQSYVNGTQSSSLPMDVKVIDPRRLISQEHSQQSNVNDFNLQSLPLDVNVIDPNLQVHQDIHAYLSSSDPERHPIYIMNMYSRGKIDLDYALDYLESQYIYQPDILEKLESRRAFKYLNTVSVSLSETRYMKIVTAYVDQLLAKDPDNPDALLYLVRDEKDETKVIDRYHQILTKHPNHPNTLSALGYRLLEKSPEDAIVYLNKANRLDASIGLVSLGIAYEKLGDLKTAWFCYKKSVTLRNREEKRKRRFPPPRICILSVYIDSDNMYAIERGDFWKSEIRTLPNPNGKGNRRVRTFLAANAEQKREIQEFYQFRDWINGIAKKGYFFDRNNFLVREIDAHLKGKDLLFEPERIVRAYEITTRHPGVKGTQLLKEIDPEIASEVERLLN